MAQVVGTKIPDPDQFRVLVGGGYSVRVDEESPDVTIFCASVTQEALESAYAQVGAISRSAWEAL
jgi:hypothetical protein